MDSRETTRWEGDNAPANPQHGELAAYCWSAFRAFRALFLPLRGAPLQEILGARAAQMGAAVLHHHLAVDVAGGIGNQETREIGKLTVFADTNERIFRRPSFVAALGPKLARCAGGRKRARRYRNGADTLGSPLHSQALGHRENGGFCHRRW